VIDDVYKDTGSLFKEPSAMTTGTYVDEKERFRTLATLQLPRLYAISRRLVGDDAEDAVQDCLLRAFRKFSQLEDESAGPAWMASILINVCRDRGRYKARHPEEVSLDDAEEFSLYRTIADEDPFPYSDSLHLDFLHQFTREDVRHVLLSLPEIYRVPLVLVHMDGFATKEVAKIIEAPLGTVLARLHRGRKMFERRMWDYARESGMLKEVVS
jgi:RNA polymerase sigma-70 factor, ECF subfamily